MKDAVHDLLTRGVAEVIDRDHLEQRLLSGTPLRVKFGIDPTSPFLHLGRASALLKLKDFQDLGHTVIFLVGDFTGVIGDTSDKESERPMLSAETVKENMRTYMDQAAKILDISKVEMYYNSAGLENLGYREIGEQADRFSLAEFIARENIKKRLDAGKRVSLREVLYPLMQGYDSVALRSDVEIGGTDQRFNLLSGRKLQEQYGQEPQDVLLLNLIPGTDGRKMSSSWGNTINILDMPNDMFGKVMSIPDELIGTYFIHCTRVPMNEISEMESSMRSGFMNPRDTKLRLAREVVSLLCGKNAGDNAERFFVETFSKKNVPESEVIKFSVSGKDVTVLDALVQLGFASSRTDARRKIEQGGVSVGEEKITDHAFSLREEVHNGKLIKVGKRHFARIIFKSGGRDA